MGNTERRLSAIEARLDKLEPKKKALNPRSESEEISSGESTPHHIGAKTREVIIQEFNSAKNSFKPQTLSNDEKLMVIEELEKLTDDVNSGIFSAANPERINMIMEIEKMLGRLR